MLARTLNLGILAHVDAGKTTLTERLLHAAGVIDELGSVDDGTTQTDTLTLERQRGITIKSAVVSFAVDDVTVNLIDTPGHPDFIAEVERVLSVLDGAVLVLSAVEGVQAQTSVLMRALQRLQVPTLLFVNKIDRVGADPERVLAQIAERLTPAAVPMGSTSGLGTRGASFAPSTRGDDLVPVLAERDEELLAAYVEDEASLPYDAIRGKLADQSRRALVHPVYFGSAMTGAGVDALMESLAELLPAFAGDSEAPLSGTVFKIERGPAGEKVAYVRLFSGTLKTRDRVRFGEQHEGKVTAIRVFDRGPSAPHGSVRAGQIGQVWGLGAVQVGDAVGVSPPRARRMFAPPTLETVIQPADPAEKGALRSALAQLAEQDPLIDVRQDDERQELSVSLYGEVQKEVVQATLAADYGLEVTFRETTTICIERPVGTGAALELLGEGGNPFLATVGLRVAPGPLGSGICVALDVEVGSLPLYVYGAVEPFRQALEETVRGTLREGLYGWQVADCAVTLTQCAYAAPSTGAQGLPPAHAHRRHERATGGGDRRVRARRPLQARASGDCPGRRAAGAGAPGRRAPSATAARCHGRGRGRDHCGARARAAARGPRPDAWRGRARDRVRALRAGHRSRPDAAAVGCEPPQSQGVSAPRDAAAARPGGRTCARVGCIPTSS